MYIQQQQSGGLAWTVRMVLVVIVFVLTLTNPAQAETTITNNVWVTADSTGESRAAVRTVVNGVVIEDWSATGSGTVRYTNQISTTTTGNVTQYDERITSSQADRDRLVELIAHLQALIALYVSLLTSQ